MTRLKQFRVTACGWIACIASLLILASSSATALHVTVQIGDSLHSIALDRLHSSARWPEIARLNNISRPSLIYPGQILLLPDNSPLWFVESATGTIEVKLANGAWGALDRKLHIPSGSVLRTGPSSRARLNNSTGDVAVIRESSEVIINPQSSLHDEAMSIHRGAVFSRIMRRGNADYRVSTPTTVSGVRGTDFLVEYLPDNSRGLLSVHGGAVTNQASDVETRENAPVMVESGFGSITRINSPPGTPIPLPAAPVLMDPRNDGIAAIGEVLFQWMQVPGGAEYRFELASDPDFMNFITAAIVQAKFREGDRASVPISVPQGDFYWRISARDASGLEGMYSEIRHFVTKKPKPPGNTFFR